MRKPLATPNFTRRRLLGTTAAGVAATSLAACATSGGDEDTEDVNVGDDPENPFGVDPAAPLDIVIFDGGFGTEYAVQHEAMYQEKFPEAEIEHLATQAITETQQPRFAEGRPTDVLANAGSQQIPMDSLIGDGELAELTPLLDAPSFDDPNVKVRDTLRPGTIEAGTFNDKVYGLYYAYTAWTLWYDNKLFTDHGWTAPTTWNEFMDLGDEIKAAGIAPFIYTGVHTQYLFDMFMILAGRHGGVEVVKAVDNLEPDAWHQESIVLAAEAMHSLWERGFIYEGAPGLDHIQSQTVFNEREAAFIPNGSWLPNEQKGVAPADFEYVPIGIPYLEGSVQPGLVSAGGNDPFVVPEKANNKAGAYEYLRIMLSKEGAKIFGDTALAATAVADVELDNPAAKAADALISDPDDIFQPKMRAWYTKMEEVFKPAIGEMMAGDSSPDEFLGKMQDVADEVAADDSIEKFEHDE